MAISLNPSLFHHLISHGLNNCYILAISLHFGYSYQHNNFQLVAITITELSPQRTELPTRQTDSLCSSVGRAKEAKFSRLKHYRLLLPLCLINYCKFVYIHTSITEQPRSADERLRQLTECLIPSEYSNGLRILGD